MSTTYFPQFLFVLLTLALDSICTYGDSSSPPEYEVGTSSSTKLNGCELSMDTMMFCNCDANEPSEAEDVKCGSWGSPEELDEPWEALGNLRSMTSLEFNNRPERALKHFPPPQLFEDLQKLTYFSMKLSQFEKLPPYAFANSSSLSEVTLIDNMIGKLESMSLANMENVSKINLGKNVIREINRNVFVNLPQLQFLYLDGNRLQVIHDFAFKELGYLEELDLQKNNLSVIAREVFAGLKRVVKLDLQRNMIEFLGDHVFADMPLLQELDLHGNQIRSVSPSAFHGLKSLARLDLKRNKIVSLYPPTFSHMGMIYMLDLRENELDTLSETLIEPIYFNLKNVSMQLMIEGNRLMCDCRILWVQKLYRETESDHVKRHLERIQCDLFLTPEQKLRELDHGVTVSYSSNVTVVAAPPEETTTYAFDGIKNVIELNPSDFKCHEQNDQKDFPVSHSQQQDANANTNSATNKHGHNDGTQKAPVASENKKDLQQSDHQSHVDAATAPNAPNANSRSTNNKSQYLSSFLSSFICCILCHVGIVWGRV